MAKDSNDYNGTSDAGSVEATQYTMPSWQKRNVDSMSKAMGYHDTADLANTSKPPTEMSNKPGVRRNMQESPALPNPGHNDRSE